MKVGGLAVLAAAWCGCALPLPAGPLPERKANWVATLDTDTAPPNASENAGLCVATEAEAIARALVSSPEAARFEGEARALLSRSRMSFADAPELRLNNLRLDRLVSGPERAELALRVPIARPGTLTGERLLLEAEAEAARARAELEKGALAADLRLLWARQVYAAERVAIARAEEGRLARAVVDRQAQGQESSTLDREILAAEHLRARAELSQEEGERARWQARLASLMGVPACDTTGPVELDVRGEVADALANRPELGRLFAEKEQAELARMMAERNTWPWFRWLQLSYEVDRGFAPDTFGFGIAIELPFSAWDGAAAEAEAVAVSGLQKEAGLWVVRIRSEVDAARAELERRLAELASQEALAATLTAERIDKLRSDAPGEVLAEDIAGLHRERARLLYAVAEARLGVLQARASLLSALGRLD